MLGCALENCKKLVAERSPVLVVDGVDCCCVVVVVVGGVVVVVLLVIDKMLLLPLSRFIEDALVSFA